MIIYVEIKSTNNCIACANSSFIETYSKTPKHTTLNNMSLSQDNTTNWNGKSSNATILQDGCLFLLYRNDRSECPGPTHP